MVYGIWFVKILKLFAPNESYLQNPMRYWNQGRLKRQTYMNSEAGAAISNCWERLPISAIVSFSTFAALTTNSSKGSTISTGLDRALGKLVVLIMSLVMFSNPSNVFLVRFSSCVKGFPFTPSAIICLLDLCHFTSSISFVFWNAIYILIWSNMLSLDIHCNYIDVLQWWRVKKNDLYTPNQNALFSFTKEWNWKHWKGE